MNLNNFSLRWLTTLNALAVVLGFLMFYLTFKYFWSHDREVAQVLQLQQAELQRVETLLSLERKAMGGFFGRLCRLGLNGRLHCKTHP